MTLPRAGSAENRLFLSARMSGSWCTNTRQNWVGTRSDEDKVTGWIPISCAQSIQLCPRGTDAPWSSDCEGHVVDLKGNPSVSGSAWSVRSTGTHTQCSCPTTMGFSFMATRCWSWVLNVKDWLGLGRKLFWVPWHYFLGHSQWNFSAKVWL